MTRPLGPALIVATALLLPRAALAAQVTGGPMVGASDDTTARIWVRADAPCKVAVRFWAEADTTRAETPAVDTRPALDQTAVVTLEGLAPDRPYRYEVLVDGRALEGGPWSFRTLPAPGAGKVTIAFGSCVHLQRQPVQPIFDAIAAAHPSAFVFVGDSCYLTPDDCTDLAKVWARYRAQRENASLRGLIASTPIFATWDDHDYGPNDSDRTFALKKDTRRVFMGYFPSPSYGEDDEGIYTIAHLGPVDLFLTDDRWWRDPGDAHRTPETTILGVRQRAWLIEGLAASRAPIKVVAVGSQVLATNTPFEGLQDAKEERQAIVQAIKDRAIGGVMFISGDRHLCEVVRWPAERAGYALWDVTSSPLANTTFVQGAALPEADRVFVDGTTNNFGWIEVDAAARRVHLELRDQAGRTLWSVEPDDLWPQAAGPRGF